MSRVVRCLVRLYAAEAGESRRSAACDDVEHRRRRVAAGAAWRHRYRHRNQHGVQSLAVADGSGRYRFESVAPGRYRMGLDLEGFATAEIPELELPVGQNVSASHDESRRARGNEHRLGAVTARRRHRAQVASNIDRRQMAELPHQGRNCHELMAKSITANNVTNNPGVNSKQFQMNLDGQQVAQGASGSGFGQALATPATRAALGPSSVSASVPAISGQWRRRDSAGSAALWGVHP